MCFDIEGTAIEELLFSMGYDESYFEDDNENLSTLLSGLLSLKNEACNYLYALQGDGELLFFDSEPAFKAVFDRDWTDEEWDTLDDDLLSEWIDRLSIEDDERLIE